MKKSALTLISIFLFTAITFATKVPGMVQKAFEQKFPHATSVRWDKESAHEYEATFEWKGSTYSANFTISGEWLETESVIAFGQLPAKVQAAFADSHKGKIAKGAAKIETSKGILKYEVEFKQGNRTIELFYSEDGTLLQK